MILEAFDGLAPRNDDGDIVRQVDGDIIVGAWNRIATPVRRVAPRGAIATTGPGNYCRSSVEESPQG